MHAGRASIVSLSLSSSQLLTANGYALLNLEIKKCSNVRGTPDRDPGTL